MVRLPALAALLLVSLGLCAPAQAAPGKSRVPAKWAKAHKLTKAAVRKDVDRDGLSGWAEWRSHTHPRKADSDRDGRPDGREDRDRDGLANGFEVSARTDPGRADSDRDGRRDGREDADRDGLVHAAEAKYGYLPRRADSDGDGVRDGDENPGVVSAVAGSQVTIALARGGSLVASLDEGLEVACEPLAALEAGPGPGPDDDAGADDEDELLEDDEALDEAEDEALDEEDEGLDPALDSELDSDLETLDRRARTAGDEGDGCAPALRPGALVHSAATEPGPAGPVIWELVLLG